MQEGSFSFSSQNLLARLVAPVLGCLTAAVLGMVLVSDRENSLASFMNIVGFFGFFIGAISPRVGLYLLIFLCGYLDFIKRLLILFGDANLEDVTYVLRVAPFVLVGIVIGLVVSYALKRFQFKMLDWLLIGLVALLEAAILASNVRSGTGIAGAANAGAYVPLIIIIPLVLRSTDEMLTFCRGILIAFFPVALYGIWQGLFGLADFEYKYLLSGLTITAGTLDELHPRPFSTLNSGHAFEVAMGICVLLSIMLSMRTLRNKVGLWNNGVRIVLPVVFFVASILGLGRTGWCVWLFGGIGLFAFKTRKRIITFYSVAVVAFALLVANAQFIYDRLDIFQSMLPTESEFSQQAFRLGTYSERLFGYINIFANPELLTWFGNPALADQSSGENREEVVHDAIGQLLVTYGIVGVVVALSAGGLFLAWAHRRTLHMPSERARAFGIGLLSVVMGVISTAMLTGSPIGLFPINFIFWAVIGIMISLSRSEAEESRERLAPGIVRPHRLRKIAMSAAQREQLPAAV